MPYVPVGQGAIYYPSSSSESSAAPAPPPKKAGYKGKYHVPKTVKVLNEKGEQVPAKDKDGKVITKENDKGVKVVQYADRISLESIEGPKEDPPAAPKRKKIRRSHNAHLLLQQQQTFEPQVMPAQAATFAGPFHRGRSHRTPVTACCDCNCHTAASPSHTDAEFQAAVDKAVDEALSRILAGKSSRRHHHRHHR